MTALVVVTVVLAVVTACVWLAFVVADGEFAAVERAHNARARAIRAAARERGADS